MDKYIIDGVEYSYGEEVEVRDYDTENWEKYIFVQYIERTKSGIICVENHPAEINNFKNNFKFDVSLWKYIRKLQTKPLSGRKAKLTLDDGTEYSVVVE